jgi:hypothetical protein
MPGGRGSGGVGLNQLILSESATTALRLAAAQRPAGGYLTTGRVLAVLARVDATNAWERLWLHSGDPSGFSLADAPDTLAQASLETWENVPLSLDMTNALSTLGRLCEMYKLAPASTGVLALALVADPAGGAARILRQRGLSHPDLLEIMQADLIGTHFEGLDDLIAPGRQGPEASTLSNSAAETLRLAAKRAATRPPDELDVLAVLAGDQATSEIIERLGLDTQLISEYEEPVRALGLRNADALEVQDEHGNVDSAGQLLAWLGENPSPGLSLLFRVIGIEPGDVAAEAMDALASAAGRKQDPGRGVVLASIANGLLSLAVMILVILNAIGSGSLWELLLIPLVWLGHPRWPSWVPLLVAVPMFFFVTPAAAAVQVAVTVADLVQARAERRRVIARTGVVVSYATARRVALRRLAKGRRSMMARRAIRIRLLGPRLLRVAARTEPASAARG